MITYTILTLSLFINIFFIWYMRQFIIRFNFYSQNSQNLMAVMEEYQTHLEKSMGLKHFMVTQHYENFWNTQMIYPFSLET